MCSPVPIVCTNSCTEVYKSWHFCFWMHNHQKKLTSRGFRRNFACFSFMFEFRMTPENTILWWNSQEFFWKEIMIFVIIFFQFGGFWLCSLSRFTFVCIWRSQIAPVTRTYLNNLSACATFKSCSWVRTVHSFKESLHLNFNKSSPISTEMLTVTWPPPGNGPAIKKLRPLFYRMIPGSPRIVCLTLAHGRLPGGSSFIDSGLEKLLIAQLCKPQLSVPQCIAPPIGVKTRMVQYGRGNPLSKSKKIFPRFPAKKTPSSECGSTIEGKEVQCEVRGEEWRWERVDGNHAKRPFVKNVGFCV